MPGSVAPINPVKPTVQTTSTAPPTTVGAIPVPPAAPNATGNGKSFGDTKFGQILTAAGGLTGITAAAGNVVNIIKGQPVVNPADPTTPTGTDLTTEEPGDDGTDELTILGLPPFAFAAIVLLVFGLIFILTRKGAAAGAAA